MDAAAHEGLRNITAPVYDEPADVIANYEQYATPYDDLALLMQKQLVYLERIADTSSSQRETPRPTQVDLNTTVPFSTTVAYRTEFLVLTASAACQVGFQVGSSVQRSFYFGSADTKIIPYITQIGRGVDLLLTTTVGEVSGYLIAYPE